MSEGGHRPEDLARERSVVDALIVENNGDREATLLILEAQAIGCLPAKLGFLQRNHYDTSALGRFSLLSSLKRLRPWTMAANR